MIEETLLKSNFVGKDGFIWWIGQVADPKVWRTEKTRIDNGTEAWGYRCKVRIIGYHSFSRNELPDDDLPWAHVMTSASDGAPGQGGFGKLPLLVGGESVVGFFLDGDEAQQPVIMGCFHRSPMVANVPNPNPFDAFTGEKGVFAKGRQETRRKRQSDVTIKETPTSIGDGSQFIMQSNPNFGTDNLGSLTLDPGFVPLSTNTQNIAGSAWTYKGTKLDTLFSDERGEASFIYKISEQEPVKGDNGCSNNVIDQITSTLQNFIKFINGLEYTALGFIDPLRNKIVDIKQSIKKVARLIVSAMKFVINGIRDNIFGLVGCLFKVLGITLPSPITLPISEATKNILNIIFCIFEKLFGPLWDFVEGLLNGLIGKSPNIPRCAAEETIAALIAKLADMVDGALSTVLSGLDWLSGGISSITGTLTNGLNFISQILSFLDCDSLQCANVTSWDPFAGVSLPKPDKWQKILDNIDILGAVDGNIDIALGFLSMFGSSDTPFTDCRQSIVNPKNQDDAPSIRIGTKYYKCIPPEIIINGDGVDAQAQAIVSSVGGSILTIKIINPGKGYTTPPSIQIIDKTRYGSGAVAQSKITQNGQVESIILIETGSGYCQTNLNEIVTGIGSTAVGQPTTGGTQNVGISTVAVGVVTSIIIDSPGVGYTSGDIISIGNCAYQPVLSQNGSIISVKSSKCTQEFNTYPEVIINTTTGEGASLYPVLDYLPQYVIDNSNIGNTRVGIGTTIVNVVDCV